MVLGFIKIIKKFFKIFFVVVDSGEFGFRYGSVIIDINVCKYFKFSVKGKVFMY